MICLTPMARMTTSTVTSVSIKEDQFMESQPFCGFESQEVEKGYNPSNALIEEDQVTEDVSTSVAAYENNFPVAPAAVKLDQLLQPGFCSHGTCAIIIIPILFFG